MAQDPLYLLCVEPSFPGRLGAVADWLVRRRGYRCHFYCADVAPQEHWPEAVGSGLEVVQFGVGGVAREPAVPWQRHLERGLCYAYGCWEMLESRRPRPIDLVLGRSAGLGSTLFVPVTLPGVPIVNVFDYFYHAHAHDLAEEAGPDTPLEYFHWRRSAGAMDLLDLENGVVPWTSTQWQRDLFPGEYRDDFLVLYHGVDSRRFAQRSASTRTVAGRSIPPGTRVISFVAHWADRLRGFDRFMNLANRLLRDRSDVLCVVVGASPVQRGLDVEFFNRDYRSHVLAQTPPHDPERIWFLGSVTPPVVVELLAASDLHIYPSHPYVVSQSLVEAMAAGCIVLAWDCDPVREFIDNGQTGLLVPPDDPEAWERAALAVLDDPSGHRSLGEAAQELVQERYDRDVVLPKLAETFGQLVPGIEK